MINTGGGRFNRSEVEPVYFVAGQANDLTLLAPTCDHLLIAVNELMHDGRPTTLLDAMIDDPKNLVFLDSGIFWLTNEHARRTGCSMDVALSLAPDEINDFDRLWDRYLYLVRRYESRLWGYIELDQGGAENKRKTRARLHAEGLRPIPVYHPLNDGWDYFDELAETHDRICLGNVVQASTPLRWRILATVWERAQKYPHLWIHVLGLSHTEMFWALPFQSSDSSSWIAGNKWSGYRERCAGKVVGGLPKDFQYRLGDGVGADKGKVFSANGCWFNAVNLQNHCRRLRQEGFDLHLGL